MAVLRVSIWPKSISRKILFVVKGELVTTLTSTWRKNALKSIYEECGDESLACLWTLRNSKSHEQATNWSYSSVRGWKSTWLAIVGLKMSYCFIWGIREFALRCLKVFMRPKKGQFIMDFVKNWPIFVKLDQFWSKLTNFGQN